MGKCSGCRGPGLSASLTRKPCGQHQRTTGGGPGTDGRTHGGQFSVSRKFCLGNQKQLNKSSRTTAVRNCSCWVAELFYFSLSFQGLQKSQRLAEASCQLVRELTSDGQEGARQGAAVTGKQLLQHVVVSMSQNLELGGTDVARGGRSAGWASTWIGAWGGPPALDQPLC